MSAVSEALVEFHAAFDDPGTLDLWTRTTLHDEEHAELHDALAALAELKDLDAEIDGAHPLIAHRRAVARELADVVYVAYGTAFSLGIDLDVALAEVHRANMAKLPEIACRECEGTGYRSHPTDHTCETCKGTGKVKGKPVYRESDRKVLKPDDWQPPDMRGAIRVGGAT